MGFFNFKKKMEEPKRIINIKGFEIGSIYLEEKKKIVTSLGSIRGLLYIDTTEDNMIYQVMWFPSGDGKQLLSITEIEVNSIKIGLENKYSISLDEDDDNEDTEVTLYKSSIDNYRFIFSIKNNSPDDYEMTFTIYDQDLYSSVKEKQQEEINRDF